MLGGDVRAARERSVAALQQSPEHPLALHLYALCESCEGSFESAIAALRRAVALQPDRQWYCELGALHAIVADWKSAAKCFANAAGGPSADAYASVWWARALAESGQRARARQALGALDAGADWQTWYDLAAVHRTLGNQPAETAALDRCVALNDAFRPAQLRLAVLKAAQMRYYTSASHAERAAELQPDADTLGVLGAVRWHLGRIPGAVSALDGSLALQAHPEVASSRLHALLFDPQQTSRSLIAECAAWASRYGSDQPLSSHANSRVPARRLRIGYLTGEFHETPSFHFMYPFLAAHDRRRFELFYYQWNPERDRLTAEYRKLADRWRNLGAVSIHDAAARIRQDEVDILVDLSGHFPANALPVFAHRPAPIQVTYPNFPNSTGLAAIDYIITDAWATPPGTDDEYAETPFRLPRCYLTYGAPTHAEHFPSRSRRGRNGITFGFFQQPAKMNQGVWDVVARILEAVPRSTLLLHFGSRELDSAGPARQGFCSELVSRGISRDRVRFVGWRPLREHLSIVSQADIALDAFPYNGQTTTCECLWMGVPVVNLTGAIHAARVGRSILTAVGLGDWVARSAGEYVAIAVAAAQDAERLCRLRDNLRRKMLASSLLDGRGLTRAIEEAYRTMWRRWCSSPSPKR